MKYILSILLTIMSFATFAQTAKMADAMRENGKIYVVVGVLTFVFIGIVVYLIMLDRKIGAIEKKLKD